ncbi:MAG: carboxypeptidase regulatory-like domain-containing protein [Cytophagales bacterium]|nr:MAG: carboxypeptidase regulatory-like domain-containing protein [Cytophagales bacterium]
MKNQNFNLLALFILFSLASLSTAWAQCDMKVKKQGIKGQILWREGNFMPTMDGNKNKNQKAFIEKGISRELFVYALTKTKDTEREGVFFTKINTKKIAQISSNEEGCFALDLPTGKYSLFVLEPNQQWFANRFDGEGNIMVIEVKKKQSTEVNIIIDYKATY